jgi:hypothetical protein
VTSSVTMSEQADGTMSEYLFCRRESFGLRVVYLSAK